MDIEQLKQKIEQTTILSDKEKKEWIYLLPRMTEEQVKELERLVAVKMPAPRQNVESRILNVEKAGTTMTSPAPPHEEGSAMRPGEVAPPKPIFDIQHSKFQRFASLTVDDLHRAPSVYIFLEELQKKIQSQKTSGADIFEILAAFEKSPLQAAYLASGVAFIDNKGQAPLTREEFESIADFRAGLKRLI